MLTTQPEIKALGELLIMTFGSFTVLPPASPRIITGW